MTWEVKEEVPVVILPDDVPIEELAPGHSPGKNLRPDGFAADPLDGSGGPPLDAVAMADTVLISKEEQEAAEGFDEKVLMEGQSGTIRDSLEDPVVIAGERELETLSLEETVLITSESDPFLDPDEDPIVIADESEMAALAIDGTDLIDRESEPIPEVLEAPVVMATESDAGTLTLDEALLMTFENELNTLTYEGRVVIDEIRAAAPETILEPPAEKEKVEAKAKAAPPRRRASRPPEPEAPKPLAIRIQRRIILCAGALGILVLGTFLTIDHAAPGELSRAHNQIPGLAFIGNCERCHRRAGLVAGCLDCHEEIGGQLDHDQGFHGYLMLTRDRSCLPCHREHLGNDFPLSGPVAWRDLDRDHFQHPHLGKFLEGKHLKLECEECHQKKAMEKISLARFPQLERPSTFLGLQQDCNSCHEDIHSRGLSRDCASCHTEDSFLATARFDHSRHFPLIGGHVKITCDRCHLIPDRINRQAPVRRPEGFPFQEALGKECSDCHQTPHRTEFTEACDHCHALQSSSWLTGAEGMTLDLHEQTGFGLLFPHSQVACDRCHDSQLPYPSKYPDPQLPGYLRAVDTCQGCHPDVHGGQFFARDQECIQCHSRPAFLPHTFGPEEHARVYPLENSHQSVECRSCHLNNFATQVRTFVGTTQECKDCHENPHGEQFEERGKPCTGCHDTRQFVPGLFGLEQHEAVFALQGSHRATPCLACHPVEAGTQVRIFAGSPMDCKGCHANPHGAQFTKELLAGDCTTCHHQESDTFAIPEFDHTQRTTYPLLGAHAKATCNQCHVETRPPGAAPDAVAVRIYRETPRECAPCHRDIHRGQLRNQGKETICSECHDSTEKWSHLKFDHDRQSRFPLDGSHVKVPCQKCHPSVNLEDGSTITQYKPLGMECKNCHEVVAH